MCVQHLSALTRAVFSILVPQNILIPKPRTTRNKALSLWGKDSTGKWPGNTKPDEDYTPRGVATQKARVKRSMKSQIAVKNFIVVHPATEIEATMPDQ